MDSNLHYPDRLQDSANYRLDRAVLGPDSPERGGGKLDIGVLTMAGMPAPG